MLKKIINWFRESNRKYHFLFALPVCAIVSVILLGVYLIFYGTWAAFLLSCRGTAMFIAGLAMGMELKDAMTGCDLKNPLKWKWKYFDLMDFAVTLAGGLTWLLFLLIVVWIVA